MEVNNTPWPEFLGEQSYRDDYDFCVSSAECFAQSFMCRTEAEVETVRRYAARHPEVGHVFIRYDHDYQVWHVQQYVSKLEIVRREDEHARN